MLLETFGRFCGATPKACIPWADITVNEQFASFREEFYPTAHTQQTRKYGVKVFWACNSEALYPLSVEIYLGWQLQHQDKDAERCHMLAKATEEI